MPRLTFVSTHALTAALDLDSATLTEAEHARLHATLIAATHQIELLTGRHLMPRRLNLPHVLPRRVSGELILDQDLLELTGITNGDGSSIPPEAVEQAGGLLYTRQGYEFRQGEDGRAQPLIVSGIWGWHDDWPQAWRSSGDSVNGTLIPFNTTVIPVTNAVGGDSEGTAPRFQVGHLLKLNAEYMALHAVDAVDNSLRVLRGQLGTTVSDHEAGTAIRIYNPPPAIESLIVRWAVWLYQLPQHHQRTSVPMDLMAEVAALQRVSVKS